MNPPPDLDDGLSAIAEHGSRTLRPRPVDAVISRGRRRARRQRAAVGALAAVAVAGVAITAQTVHPSGTGEVPAAAPATSAVVPAADPAPPADLTGTTPVRLRLADASEAAVIAGADDDDRVLVDEGQTKQYPGEDNQARSRWLLVPGGDGTFSIAQAVARTGGKVCMGRQDDGALRVRLCKGTAVSQRFTVTAAGDRQAYALEWNGSPVRVGGEAALTTAGSGPVVLLRITAAG